ncbi:MAG: hypothetical protein IT160_12850 [Bryobacterales bacterium]|nr:hypothetical protein [Bryobacterales bacterium]
MEQFGLPLDFLGCWESPWPQQEGPPGVAAAAAATGEKGEFLSILTEGPTATEVLADEEGTVPAAGHRAAPAETNPAADAGWMLWYAWQPPPHSQPLPWTLPQELGLGTEQNKIARADADAGADLLWPQSALMPEAQNMETPPAGAAVPEGEDLIPAPLPQLETAEQAVATAEEVSVQTPEAAATGKMEAPSVETRLARAISPAILPPEARKADPGDMTETDPGPPAQEIATPATTVSENGPAVVVQAPGSSRADPETPPDEKPLPGEDPLSPVSRGERRALVSTESPEAGDVAFEVRLHESPSAEAERNVESRTLRTQAGAGHDEKPDGPPEYDSPREMLRPAASGAPISDRIAPTVGVDHSGPAQSPPQATKIPSSLLWEDAPQTGQRPATPGTPTLHLQMDREGSQVRVHLTQVGNQVRVAVRTNTGPLTDAMRAGLPELLQDLERSGVHAVAAIPESGAMLASGPESRIPEFLTGSPNSSWQDPGFTAEDYGGENRQERHRRQRFEEWMEEER